MTMVVAPHEMGFAAQVADEVVFLADGVVVEQGPPQHVIEAPTMRATQEFLRRVHEAGRLYRCDIPRANGARRSSCSWHSPVFTAHQ